MFSTNAYENSQREGIGVLQIVDEGDLGEGQPRRFVPLKRTRLSGEVFGPLAQLSLVHVYGYTKEQTDKSVEAVYRFPLPGDAAVTGVRVQFGDVEIQTELKERERATIEYEEARREGRQAALATRESPDVFTLCVTGILPDQDVTVETTYVQLAQTEEEGWGLRVPLTTSPRYIRSDETTSRHALGQPLVLLRDPGHRFSLDIIVRGADLVESDTHLLDVSGETDGLHVCLRDGEVVPDRDCVLWWRASKAEDRSALQILLHEDSSSGQVYFLALLAPPAVQHPGSGVPREIVLLVDHSGSMTGAKWEAADWAIEAFLSNLTGSDAFALGLFHNTTRWLSRRLRQGGSAEITEAVRFLKEHHDSGGTELGVALEQALDIERSSGERSRHVLIVTDGQVTDGGRILRLVSEEAGREHNRRVSVLCIDAAPNSHLVLEIAERTGGLAKFLTSASEAEDVTTALDRILENWSAPVLADLRLSVSRAEVEATGCREAAADEPGWSAIDLGDLPSGRAIWVVGRVPRGESSDLILRVTTSEDHEIAACRLGFEEKKAECPALKALFGARRLLALEYLISSGYDWEDLSDQLTRLGYDPGEIVANRAGSRPRVYAENTRVDAQEVLRELLVREALDYGLASSETAFVAVRREMGKPVDATVFVASALPSGWSDEFLHMSHPPAVSTNAPTPFGAALALDLPTFMRRVTDRPRDARRRLSRTSRSMFSFGLGRATYPSSSESAEPVLVFTGVPNILDGSAVLFDSSRERDRAILPESGVIRRLVMRSADGRPEHRSIDRRIRLLIYVGDLSSPRARVRVADLVRQGGERPLNLSRTPGQPVRVVLMDPAGAWAREAPQVQVLLGW